jgi:hypothetical protein
MAAVAAEAAEAADPACRAVPSRVGDTEWLAGRQDATLTSSAAALRSDPTTDPPSGDAAWTSAGRRMSSAYPCMARTSARYATLLIRCV